MDSGVAQVRSKPHYPLFDSSEWDFPLVERVYGEIERIARDDLGLCTYSNQIEIISSEQMLDAHCSIGMPVMYRHWSFGKRFVHEHEMYRRGYQALAYEIVINSNPCISYYMEENTMAMQTLVLAHAAFGHNHFFKNNYLFLQWTDADGILDYLNFARAYIARCEERYGVVAVELMLDAAHALMDQGVFRYPRKGKPNEKLLKERERERLEHEARTYEDLWRTVPQKQGDAEASPEDQDIARRGAKLKLPEENLLYFIEKNSPVLEPWQREILRIVRNVSQYFYPQKQTKVMNEGCATFVHHYIVNKLYDEGLITEGALLEVMHSHSNVIFQPGFDDPRYRGINPYALGFSMMTDIKRICEEPTDEDRYWFPAFAGSGDWRGVLKDAWANYRDESFVRQFLSPKLIRDWKLFTLTDNPNDRHYSVEGIHDERGYENVRAALARSYDITLIEPDIQVVDLDLAGDRTLVLRHTMHNGVPLSDKGRMDVLDYVRQLWGYDVKLIAVDAKSGETLYEEVSSARGKTEES